MTVDLALNDTYNKELPVDPKTENSRRQVTEACFSYAMPRVPSQPMLLHKAAEVESLLGLSLGKEDFLAVFTGQKIITNSKPYAMCYGGHQFGNWAGQLGDGRAINLGELVHNDKRWAMQLKGAGETPYSRTADGLAVLRSSVREHLCSEAMHHLGVPSTRSLSLSLTGDQVMRDMLYDGNPAFEKGAVVCRVSPSFIRFGNFQIFASRGDKENLKNLADYTIKHFYPEIKVEGKEKYIAFFGAVAQKTLDMVVHWQRVGFVHGVMNTDNMSILGLTIDYGPYGWLEGYEPDWTPNTTDAQHRRYRYGQQVNIALWNLVQLANAIYLLVEEAEPLQKLLNSYNINAEVAMQAMWKAKLGLKEHDDNDAALIAKLEETLIATETDFIIFFRNLSQFQKTEALEAIPEYLLKAFYKPNLLVEEVEEQWVHWLKAYQNRLQKERATAIERKTAMNGVNPKYVLRNYMSQLAIDKADAGDYSMIAELYELLKRPYAEQKESEKWFAKRPEWARHKAGCSMLSCSS